MQVRLGQNVAAVMVFISSIAHAGTYTVTDLGTLGGATSGALAINASGQIVGMSLPGAGATKPHAFRWQGGTMIDLGTFGGPESAASDINDAGQITGYAETKDSLPFTPIMHAFRWQGGVMTDLGTTGGYSSRGTAINSFGEIAGTSQVCMVIDPEGGRPGPCFPVGNEYAFMSDGLSITDLGGLFGSPDSSAAGINSAGQIVGQSIAVIGFGQPRHAALWNGGGAIDLGTLGGLNSWGMDINDRGQLIGFSDIAPPGLGHHVFIRNVSGGPMIDLGALKGSNQAEAFAINNAGLIVGSSFIKFKDWHAFLYDGADMLDLNEFIPSGSGWVLTSATDINETGTIVGVGIHNGVERGFRLTPVDCGPDINCDGVVNTLDLGIMLSSWSIPATAPACAGTQPCPADLNHDGFVNTLDLGILLSGWSL